MKAVIPDVPEYVLEDRKRTGADRWDEMWEGVLHMAATPNKRHNRLQFQLCDWLDKHWAATLRESGRFNDQRRICRRLAARLPHP